MNPFARLTESLQRKILVAHLIVIGVGVSTLLLAATFLAPSFFERHMTQMGAAMPGRGPWMAAIQGEMAANLTAIFHQAVAESLAIAALAAIVTAVLVSVALSGRIARPIRRVAAASRRIANGQYGERVPDVGRDEVGQLVESFNAMAAALEGTERRRMDLIGDVAHELRTPIATLQGYLEGLIDEVVSPSQETWARLKTETGRLHRLVEDLEELSRAEARELRLALAPVEPNVIVVGAVNRLDAAFVAKGVDLQIEVSPELPRVNADSERAIQVLTNLLSNALRYTPVPGRVTVAARRAGGSVRFDVADTGIGIAAEHLPHIFERFYRVDKSRARQSGGTGIGLAIAEALTEAMGGRISVASPGVGQGTTVGFDLPVSALEVPSVALARAADSSLSARS
jgi:signal transduction histidine kinase